jgi:hypothetical protein
MREEGGKEARREEASGRMEGGGRLTFGYMVVSWTSRPSRWPSPWGIKIRSNPHSTASSAVQPLMKPA